MTLPKSARKAVDRPKSATAIRSGIRTATKSTFRSPLKSPLSSAYRPALAMLAMTLVLAGCAGFSGDGGRARVDALAGPRLGQPWSASRDALRNPQAAQDEVRRLLAAPLSADDAVRITLLNNPRVNIALADLGIAEADLVQAGRLRNPRFGFGRLSGDDGVEIDRSVMFDLVGLLTLPMRTAVEQRRFEQAQLQTALQAVRLASDTRRAYFQALAAEQSLAYLRQAALASEASAELAQRMAKAGNFSKLDEAREQAFHAEVSAQLKRAEHGALAARERLVRLLGLSGDDASLRLPERLPDLPAMLASGTDIESTAMAQRLDLQVARLDAEATAKNLGLTRATRFVNVFELGYQNKSTTGAARADGYQIELTLPVFDSGEARLRRAEASYQRTLLRTAEVALQARSEVREGYSRMRSQYQVARQYRDEIVPARKRISEEVLLRYNGMLASVFELLADARSQIASVTAAIDAQRDYWIAESELQYAIHGGSTAGGGASLPASSNTSAMPAAAGAH
ncbi:MAG: hypothetical protein RL404_992 [Pseudomonadota bacterium]